MWARVVETMLGCWLVISPFVFRHSAGDMTLWVNELACGFTVITAALASFWRPLGRAHFLIAGIALWLIGFGWFNSSHHAPAFQNYVATGLLLLMFAIIPNEANLPTPAWRELYSEEESHAGAGDADLEK